MLWAVFGGVPPVKVQKDRFVECWNRHGGDPVKVAKELGYSGQYAAIKRFENLQRYGFKLVPRVRRYNRW